MIKTNQASTLPQVGHESENPFSKAEEKLAPHLSSETVLPPSECFLWVDMVLHSESL